MIRMIQWLREPFCGISHFVGVVLSIAGFGLLMVEAEGRPWHVTGFAIYGATLVIMYLASTLYHSLPVPIRYQNWLMRLDHIAIYLLIAGTYTPVCLIKLRGVWGWSLLSTVWAIAAIGILAILIWGSKLEVLRVILCVCMGWLSLVAIQPLSQAFPPEALYWLFGGGIIYSIGTVIFAIGSVRPDLWQRKVPRIGSHDLWHLFVLAGSACHFIVMLRYVAPAS